MGRKKIFYMKNFLVENVEKYPQLVNIYLHLLCISLRFALSPKNIKKQKRLPS
jgi:hypothetical protein